MSVQSVEEVLDTKEILSGLQLNESYKLADAHFCNFRHMALHDPESTAQEKAMALKIGRQKKIQIIDGQRVSIE